MLKKNKKFFIASCIVILLPMFAGFLLWDQLPAQVATHFGRNGEADRYSSKLFADPSQPWQKEYFHQSESRSLPAFSLPFHKRLPHLMPYLTVL